MVEIKIGVVAQSIDERLKTALNKKFEEVVFAPLDGIRFDLNGNRKVIYSGVDLTSLDYVMILSKKVNDIIYTLLRMCERKTRVPVPSEKSVFMIDRIVLLNFLSKREIPIKKVLMIAGESSVEKIVKDIKFPVLATLPGEKKVTITNEKTLKEVASMFKPGYRITIENTGKKKIKVFLCGEDHIAIEKVDEKTKVVKAEKRIVEIAKKVKDLLSLDYCTVEIGYSKNKPVVENVVLGYSEEIAERSGKCFEMISNHVKKTVSGYDIFGKIDVIIRRLLRGGK